MLIISARNYHPIAKLQTLMESVLIVAMDTCLMLMEHAFRLLSHNLIVIVVNMVTLMLMENGSLMLLMDAKKYVKYVKQVFGSIKIINANFTQKIAR